MKIALTLTQIIRAFRLHGEKENYPDVITAVEKGVVFRGTNLWVLVFAIFIASLGLNVNSTAVIIGAMLVSPLMGPIMGLGLGMGINDLRLLRKAGFNFLMATGVSLATSTVFFLISPLQEAHSEILARTSPNVYDVLIALFGGLAGMLALSSRQKGNVIPGVAIATALMPPLCTAGYGLATLQANIFFGAFYLFLINTVFIALATLIVTRYLRFPIKEQLNPKDELKARRIAMAVVVITLLPSLYFGYDMVQQNKFAQKAKEFIAHETTFMNEYLVNNTIDPKTQTLTLTYLGEEMSDSSEASLRSKLPYYELDTNALIIKQGFAFQREQIDDKENEGYKLAIAERERKIQQLQTQVDSLHKEHDLSQQVFLEMKALYPEVHSLILQNAIQNTQAKRDVVWIGNIQTKERLNSLTREKIIEWLKVRIKTKELIMHFAQG